MDISQSFLKIATRRYPQLKFYKSNILDRKTLPRKKYDAFWSAATLMHIPESKWPEMLENVEGLIKKGGIGYITVPEDRPNPANNEDQRYFTLFTPTKFKELIGSRGWKVIKQGIYSSPEGRSVNWQWYIVKLP